MLVRCPTGRTHCERENNTCRLTIQLYTIGKGNIDPYRIRLPPALASCAVVDVVACCKSRHTLKRGERQVAAMCASIYHADVQYFAIFALGIYTMICRLALGWRAASMGTVRKWASLNWDHLLRQFSVHFLSVQCKNTQQGCNSHYNEIFINRMSKYTRRLFKTSLIPNIINNLICHIRFKMIRLVYMRICPILSFHELVVWDYC